MANHHHRVFSDQRGISLLDMIIVITLIMVLAGMAAPPFLNMIDQYKLGMATRDVERELQFARLKAVSSNRPMRVRFDCPSANRMRAVEVIGTPVAPDTTDLDTYLDRCDETKYPYKATQTNRLDRPGNDGPVRLLQSYTSFTAKQTLEFWPDGSVHAACQTACTTSPQIGTVTITLSRKSQIKNITVNGLGKIQMDR